MATQGALQTRPPFPVEMSRGHGFNGPPYLPPFEPIWEDSLTVLPVVSCSPPEAPSVYLFLMLWVPDQVGWIRSPPSLGRLMSEPYMNTQFSKSLNPSDKVTVTVGGTSILFTSTLTMTESVKCMD